MLCASQLGWLHAKPGDSPETRLTTAGGKWTDFPDLSGLSWIFDGALTMRLGVPSGHGGLLPHKWVDVVAFGKDVMGLRERWQVEVLMEMSEAYVVECDGAKDPLRISPMDRFRNDNG